MQRACLWSICLLMLVNLYIGYVVYSAARKPLSGNALQESTLRTIISYTASDACTAPVHSIYFLKMFKSASSTMQTMIQTFVLRNNLTQLRLKPPHPFPDPDFRKYIAAPRNVSSERADILSEHTVFCETCIRQVMSSDTRSITIIREPFSRLKSLFAFFDLKTRYKLTVPFAFEVFVKHLASKDTPQLFPWNVKLPRARGYFFRYGKEMLATQFGYLEGHPIADPDGWMHYLDSRFVLVGLVERMHESLVLMRRRLCWNSKDILYVTLRVTSPNKSDKLNISNKTTESELKSIHKSWSPIDYKLYAYFSSKFDQAVSAQPPDFHEEVTYYRALVIDVATFCNKLCPVIATVRKMQSEKCDFASKQHEFRRLQLNVTASRWHAGFRVDGVDCLLMMLNHDYIRDELSTVHHRPGRLHGRVPWREFCHHNSFLTCG